MDHSIWSRMTAFSQLDLNATLAIVARMVRAELAAAYPHFNIADIGPVLTEALRSENSLSQQIAKDLINLLGDSGFTEFGTLL